MWHGADRGTTEHVSLSWQFWIIHTRSSLIATQRVLTFYNTFSVYVRI